MGVPTADDVRAMLRAHPEVRPEAPSPAPSSGGVASKTAALLLLACVVLLAMEVRKGQRPTEGHPDASDPLFQPL